MKSRELIFILLAILIVIAIVWILVPSGASTKSQLSHLANILGRIFLSIFGFIIWLFEAAILFLTPFVTGVFRPITLLDEKLSPEKDLEWWQNLLLVSGFTLLFFFLWIGVPLLISILWPANKYLIGPWINSKIETGLIWWGVAAVASFWLGHATRWYFEDF